MSKKSAVDWFMEQDTELTINFLENKINKIEYKLKKMALLKRAKEMEKLQIEDALQWSHDNGHEVGYKWLFQEYYGEEYKGGQNAQ